MLCALLTHGCVNCTRCLLVFVEEAPFSTGLKATAVRVSKESAKMYSVVQFHVDRENGCGELLPPRK